MKDVWFRGAAGAGLAAVLCSLPVVAEEPPGADRLTVREQSLGKIPPEQSIAHPVAVTADGKRIAYVVKREGQYQVVVDGVAGKPYSAVLGPGFTPDGKRVVYLGKRGDKQVLVVDEVESTEYAGFSAPSFSADGARIGYAARRERAVLVVDGKELEGLRHPVVQAPVFSPNGKRVAYVGSRDGKTFSVVLDDKEGPIYDIPGFVSGLAEPLPLLFSPDGKRLAYVAGRGETQVLVVDGKERAASFEEIRSANGGLVFSPDSKRVAYVARRRGKDVVVVDGKEGKEHDAAWGIVFSPDSKRVAYRATRWEKNAVGVPEKWFVKAVVDGSEGKEYTPDEETYAGFPFLAGNIVFSPDSRRVAYPVRRGDKSIMVVDGVEGEEYERLDATSAVFSPDSKRLAFLAARQRRAVVVVDRSESPAYGEVLLVRPGLSAKLWPPGRQLIFDSPTLLHFVAARDEEFFRVEADLGSK